VTLLRVSPPSMPVTDREGNLLGIITENDIVRLATQLL
jgi:CBS domain-containing protein